MTMRPELMKNIRTVDPYVPGEQPQHKVVKLNTNENPYPPAPGVREILRNMDTDSLRLYPDPAAEKLISALADHYGVGEDQVFAGVGSDDVLSMCFLTFSIRTSRSFSRILHIPSTRCGQSSIGSRMSVLRWMTASGS